MSSIQPISIEKVILGNECPFVLIGGPDSIESLDHALFMAENIAAICQGVGVPFIFKASYDKANRTSLNSFRGVGVQNGLEILSAIKEKIGVPVTTDVHSPQEAALAGPVVDLVQVPALLSRQTDLLSAAGKHARTVNIKKGQFLAPEDIPFVIEKVASGNQVGVAVTERGAMFGYHDIVADMRSLPIMRQYANIIFDASHTAQLPSSMKGVSGGNRENIPILARAATAVGVAGIFMEIHNDPDHAPVDGLSSLPLDQLKRLLHDLKRIDEVIKIPQTGYDE